MLVAVVLRLQAADLQMVPASSCATDVSQAVATPSITAIEAFWHANWNTLRPGWLDGLARPGQPQPYCLGCLPASNGETWLRLTSLAPRLSQALLAEWLPNLPSSLTLDGATWQVTEVATSSGGHFWAGQTGYAELVNRHLTNIYPPRGWRVRLLTPAVFQERHRDYPLPTPARLAAGWLAAWNAYGPVAFPDGLLEALDVGMWIGPEHSLRSCSLPGSRRLGCTGSFELHSRGLEPRLRAAFDTLAALAFFAGSGADCHLGLGVTRLAPLPGDDEPAGQPDSLWSWWPEGIEGEE